MQYDEIVTSQHFPCLKLLYAANEDRVLFLHHDTSHLKDKLRWRRIGVHHLPSVAQQALQRV